MDENHGHGTASNASGDGYPVNDYPASDCPVNDTPPDSPLAAQPKDGTLAESVIDSATATDSATTSSTTAIDTSADSAMTSDSATLPIVASGRRANRNRLSHGLRSSASVGMVRLELGGLPRSLRKVERAALSFRRTLEQAVIDVHGSVTLCHALSIDTACKWQRHGALALRWLREHDGTLTAEQRLSYSREIARASAERDKAIAGLKLQRDAKEAMFAMLYGERNGANG